MNKPKALVIVTPGFPADENDSTCLPPRQVFVKALKQAAPSLQIIVLTIKYPFFSKSYDWNGVKVISFGGEKQARISRIIAFFRIWLTLRRLKKENHIIGLLSFWLDKSAVIADWMARWNNFPHFCWLLGRDAEKGNRHVKLMRQNGGYLIALSDFMAREFKKNYNITPQHIIPVGIDATMFGEVQEERSIDILGVGSLIVLKQYDVFLKIIKTLTLSFPNIKAKICGAGPEMQRLHDLINKLDLTVNVSLIGALPHEEVLKLMQQSKLLLHPSKFEGFGTVNLEALYAGAKVISFVKPMDVEIENWYHVDNVDEMIMISKAILTDSARVYKSVLPFPIAKIAETVLKLYNYNADAIS